jgi:superfamily II DNA or RNA helicase
MKSPDEIKHLIASTKSELAELESRLSDLLTQLAELQDEKIAQLQHGNSRLDVNNQSTQGEKIALFRNLFHGREDVYPRRFESLKTGKKGYQPVCRNEWVSGVCGKPKTHCEDCQQRVFLPVTDTMIRNHLQGFDPQESSKHDFTIGIYPMLQDETCWFLAVDFDKTSWQDDALAFLVTCSLLSVPAALERSRSGNGGHVWMFFTEPVPAAQARQMGTFLLSQTMEYRPEIGLDSYDRFFPSQDTLPRGGFGNLIALPLQKKPRESGNSVFVNEHFIPYEDQWAFLASLHKMTRTEVQAVARNAEKQDEFLGIRLPVTDEENDRPWALPPSRKHKKPPLIGTLPKCLDLVIGNQIYIPKAELTPPLRNRLIRLAAFQNPDFYQAQGMRLSTYGKPRIISCCEDFPQHLGIPRGCIDELTALLESLQIKINLTDERFAGTRLDVQFQGVLRDEQQQAADSLLQHETGVLAASTAFGKTVVAAYLIAQRQVNTLVVVHRRQLLDQWVHALSQFLGISSKDIGQFGGGKHKSNGNLDVAMIQSLIQKGVVSDIVGNYGYLIVDECHHISAVSFEQVVRQSKAKYFTGLSATVTRKDGHQPIIFMQCGPVRYKVNDRDQANKRPFSHKVIVRPTKFHLPSHLQYIATQSIQEVYSSLEKDADRNQMIVEDVVAAIQANRFPVVLTERREHLETLAELLNKRVAHVFVMKGGMGKKQRQELKDRITDLPADQSRVILATGRYLGEGFDDERLDTLFLALPISWRGTLTQYAGRLHRLNAAKKEVIIYDYVDFDVPVLARMHSKRRSGYKALGYDIELPQENKTVQLTLVDI